MKCILPLALAASFLGLLPAIAQAPSASQQ